MCRACAIANSKLQRIKAHGISPERFLEILNEQEGQCRICSTELTSRAGQCIDHDHAHCPGDFSCGECVRGILCKHCNTLLGFARDDAELLRKAAVYVESWKLPRT